MGCNKLWNLIICASYIVKIVTLSPELEVYELHTAIINILDYYFFLRGAVHGKNYAVTKFSDKNNIPFVNVLIMHLYCYIAFTNHINIFLCRGI